jgi:hypothetical protein
MASDLSLLPSELAARSLSTNEIVLRQADVDAAIEHLVASGQRIESWEGVVSFPGGGRAKSLEHAGTFVLPSDPTRSGTAAREQIAQAQARWDRRPEYPGSTLYFRLTISKA